MCLHDLTSFSIALYYIRENQTKSTFSLFYSQHIHDGNSVASFYLIGRNYSRASTGYREKNPSFTGGSCCDYAVTKKELNNIAPFSTFNSILGAVGIFFFSISITTFPLSVHSLTKNPTLPGMSNCVYSRRLPIFFRREGVLKLMQSRKVRERFCIFSRKLRRLCSRIRWLIWRRSKPKVVIRRFGKPNSKAPLKGQTGGAMSERPIRIATFNVAMFTLAPAVPKAEKSVVFVHEDDDYLKIDSQVKSADHHPKSILKQSPLHPMMNSPEHLSKKTKLTKSNLKVSINLPDNEISLAHKKLLNVVEDENKGSPSRILSANNRSQALMRSPVCFPFGMTNFMNDWDLRGTRTILDVLREVDADILALQDVKAEEEKSMKPLSDLARALGMKYVFAESWAPEYGNAVLSKWPIKRWKVQKIFDDQDFRNVLKATIEVPRIGEFNFYCSQLDHLDENWRMKQINAIIQSNDCPHILAGGLNSLDGSDYSSERWTDIVKYYEEIGKPTPKVEVMKCLKGKGYIDGKDFAGECEPVVIIAKGQSVQGTCKYGTRVDYVMASPDSPYKFVPGSYSVISSKGTSDHHIVKVDVVKVVGSARRCKKTAKTKTKGCEDDKHLLFKKNIVDKHLKTSSL